jgi:hypothetical protein
LTVKFTMLGVCFLDADVMRINFACATSYTCFLHSLERRMERIVIDAGRLLVSEARERVSMLDLVLARHQQRACLHIRRGLLLPGLRNGFRTALMEIRFNEMKV